MVSVMMISLDNLIEAIGWGIVHSLWIGALAYCLLLLLFAAFPETQARTRHAMARSSLALVFVGFLAIFFGRLNGSFGYTEADGIRMNIPFFRYLVGGYVAGFCLQTLLLSRGYFRVRRLRNSGLLPAPEAWKAILAQIVQRMKIRRYVRLRLSEHVKMPLVVGYLKPVVLFPLGLSNHLDTDQVEAILIHELSHVRRNDYLINLLKTIIVAVLFFNPFVWLLGRIIYDEREKACDDDVLEQTGGGSGPGLAMAAAQKHEGNPGGFAE